MRKLPPVLLPGGSWFLASGFWTICGSGVATNPRMAGRLLELVDLVVRDPFHGKGKPEPLQALPDTWSRRLDQEHRLTYRITGNEIDFMQARYHYEK
ncbi:MAG TPA: Txe/YoeB family addiction module toxin [Longimicrobium sp.]|nr:Txe/YoeB family addiction module toxin [Longimicrobium sp.]